MKAYIEIEVDIDFDYQPPDAQTRDYPGCEGGVELTSALHNGVEIIDMLAPSALSALKADVVDHIDRVGEEALAQKEAGEELRAELRADELREDKYQRGQRL